MSAARRYKALPVGYVDKDTLLLAMADPANVIAVDDIQMMTGLDAVSRSPPRRTSTR